VQALHGSMRAAWWGVVAVVVLSGCAAADASDLSVPRPADVTPTSSLTPHSELSSYRSTRTHTATAPPVRLRIPAIDVDAAVQRLGLEKNGSIQVPKGADGAGWWEGGPRPGQVGPAVILGHVKFDGPAVFQQLERLQPGNEVFVEREDGTTARFVVTHEGTYRKAAFPSDLVYYPTLQPELRLVTCEGPIDGGTGRYRDNLVVFAVQEP
jgi:sortase (surface protein transpeptidase)